jgi:hypothetical protein
MDSWSVTLNSFHGSAFAPPSVPAPALGLRVDGFQVPTDRWPIFNCPWVAYFDCPPRESSHFANELLGQRTGERAIRRPKS